MFKSIQIETDETVTVEVIADIVSRIIWNVVDCMIGVEIFTENYREKIYEKLEARDFNYKVLVFQEIHS